MADERVEQPRLCGRLQEIVAETAADFEKLPIFVRPLARSGFRSKAGGTIQEWQRIAALLTAQVEAGEPVDRRRHVTLLEKLIKYLQGVPGETARFTRDQAFLQQVQERMNGYEADLRALIQAL